MSGGDTDMLAFLNGTPLYNLVNLSVGVVGLGLTIGSLMAARRAARAAVAAQSEAEQAKQLVRGIALGTELADLGGYLREANARLNDGHGGATLVYLALVRERLARASRLPISDLVATMNEWREMDDKLQELHDAIYQLFAVQPPPTRHELAGIVNELAAIGRGLATMAGSAGRVAAGD